MIYRPYLYIVYRLYTFLSGGGGPSGHQNYGPNLFGGSSVPYQRGPPTAYMEAITDKRTIEEVSALIRRSCCPRMKILRLMNKTPLQKFIFLKAYFTNAINYKYYRILRKCFLVTTCIVIHIFISKIMCFLS